jgi:Na+/melibiose symporter-like transporter
MPQSRLFVSSVSRRQLARRRQRGPRAPFSLLIALALVLVAVLAFIAVHGGL